MPRNKPLSLWKPDQKMITTQQQFIHAQIKNIGQAKLSTLVSKATEAQALSYSPYSKYQVGAAILTVSGDIYQGTNIERASYSETIHAEESAITNAMLNGAVNNSGRRFIKALAVAHKSDTAPCGHCRQIIAEHCDNCLIIVADEAGKLRNYTSLQLLLPYAFTPTDLGIK